MASYEGITNILNFAVAFNPTTAFPIDARQMFGSKTAAEAAAATAENAGSSNTVYYFGMPLVVFENDVATMYIIQGDKTLKEVGSAPIPDNATISLNEKGELQLFDFGKQYYKFHEKDNVIPGEWTYPDTMPTAETPETPAVEGAYCQAGTAEEPTKKWYKYSTDAWALTEDTVHEDSWYELVSGWKAGLEPKVVSTGGEKYAIAWYEPSTTTIEGVSNIVSSLQTEVDSMNHRIGELEQKGTVTVDEVTITKDPENGTISVKEIGMDKVSGLSSAIETAKSQAASEAKTYADEYKVAKSNIIKDGAAAGTPDAASDDKVVSEKLFVNALFWKEGM